MSVTVTPYGNSLYGAGNYSGILVSAAGRFDQPANRAASAMGTPHAALFDPNQPGKVLA